MSKSPIEQTLVLIKPDALKNSLTGYVLSCLSEFHTGLVFAGSKIVTVSTMLAEEHYTEHKGKKFFPPLLKYIKGELHYPANPESRRVIALVYQGTDAITKIRALAGPTNPLTARETKPGCIRALGTLVPVKDESGKVVDERMDNLIHASANSGDAEREIKLWFRPNDIPIPMQQFEVAECEEHYYFTDGKLSCIHSKGSSCILAPGNIAWKTDLDALRLIVDGKDALCTLETVIAKYLINEGK